MKPENFMLISKDEDSELKLIDFGLGKRFLTDETHMHSMVGTPYYIAPEVLKGDYTLKCDVWQIGVIFYILLTGYPPFNGDENKQIFDGILHKEIDFSDKAFERCSKECTHLLRQMLDKNPDERPTVQECLDHAWFKLSAEATLDPQVHLTVMKRFMDFHVHKRLQLETLRFLVKNTTFDVKALR